jgi:hypothetical protein
LSWKRTGVLLPGNRDWCASRRPPTRVMEREDVAADGIENDQWTGRIKRRGIFLQGGRWMRGSVRKQNKQCGRVFVKCWNRSRALILHQTVNVLVCMFPPKHGFYEILSPKQIAKHYI